jgi:hypothetical protein
MEGKMKGSSKNDFETFFNKDIETSLNICFEKGGSFTVYPKGTSMLPTLREGKDSVTLIPPKSIIKNGIYLYKRPNGKYAMHRLIKITDDNLIFCGDAQLVLENVKKEQILAYVECIYSGNKRKDTRLSQRLFVLFNSVFLFRKLVIRCRSFRKRF